VSRSSVRECARSNQFLCADWTPGIREYLISPLFVSTFNTNQYVRQRARSTETNASAEPLPPPTFGEMRFNRVPDTAASGAIAGALLTSWKCGSLLRSGAPFSSLRFLTSWISPCSPRSCHLRSFLYHPPTDRKRNWRAASKICFKEADTKPDNPDSRNSTLRILDATLVQVNWLPASRTRRVSVPIKEGEGCVPSTDREAREADRRGKAQRIIEYV